MLDSAEPVVGSFTADGMTYAVGPDGLTLVAVDASAVADGAIAVPSLVSYDGAAYDVTAIGPYAFYLSGATSVALLASISSVDDHALRSCDVERVEVDAGNPDLASFDGCLYDSQLTRLLLIPGGRQGAVRIAPSAEGVDASAFSHCAGVDAVLVDAGSAAYASWDGLLYDTSGQTLLRVPAGATEITIRDGCTAIAAGALEGCAKLERINAPASVTSISPDVFTSVPTVSLPAQSALQEDASSSVASALADQANASADSAPQLTAMVTLAPAEDMVSLVETSSIEVSVCEEENRSIWKDAGFHVSFETPEIISDTDDSPLAVANRSGAFSTAATTISVGRLTSLWLVVPSTGQVLGQCTAPTKGEYEHLEYNGKYSSVRFYENRFWYLNQTGGPITVGANSAGNGVSSVKYSTQATGPWTNLLPSATYTTLPYGMYYFAINGSERNVLASWDTNGGGTIGDSLVYNNASFASIGGLPTPNETLRGEGWSFDGWFTDEQFTDRVLPSSSAPNVIFVTYYARWRCSTVWDANGGAWEGGQTVATIDAFAADGTASASLPDAPVRAGYRFLGWFDAYQDGTKLNVESGQACGLTPGSHLYAQWEPYEISFDVDSEPGDADYPGEPKDPVSSDSVSADGTIPIEDPKRPGYVFEGWVLPNAGGTEAVDQDLVYQDETDGKWYVDASKLPDYAGDDGRVELTARWTSIISVDVPSSVTFYADLVTQGQESREGAAEGAFGQSKVANQSQVDLRVVGLESSAVKTEGSTLGADSILKKADAATPSTSAGKLLSLYPSTKAWTAEELQDPDAVGGDKATTAVDFDLDDILLEKSFKADDFTIAAGDTLNMGYRLNLAETGQQLDYDKLSTLSEGQSASIANVSYTFASEGHPPTATGSKDDPLWIEYKGCVYGLQDIKDSAECISERGTASPCYPLYKELLEAQATSNGKPGAGPYFQVKVDGRFLDLQLIGIAQDIKSDGSGKAGLTFQMRDLYARDNTRSAAAGGGAFNYTYMNSGSTNAGGWSSSRMRTTLRSVFWNYLPAEIRAAIARVDKYQQLPGGTDIDHLQRTTNETVWQPSMYEVFGVSIAGTNESEALVDVGGFAPFQYQAYQGNAGALTNAKVVKTFNGVGRTWWLRSATRSTNNYFCRVDANGPADGGPATSASAVAPCFCL